MVTIVGDKRTKFDEIVVNECIHRYFADTADSDTAAAVESTFGPSLKRAETARLKSGLPENLAMYAWLDEEDNSLPPVECEQTGTWRAAQCDTWSEYEH